MGTVGYIAPELTRTGKATPSSDVFSFGVLLLEVACGRKPVDVKAERQYLVEWVWELYAHGGLLDAADPELGNEYEAGEMEKVLKLGLLCSSSEPEKRLGIRQVCQILEGEASLPDVHMATVHREGRTEAEAETVIRGLRETIKICIKLCEYPVESLCLGFFILKMHARKLKAVSSSGEC
jgi:hypothetical protein